MSVDKLPVVSFQNKIQRQQIAVRMYNHRRRLLELQLKKPKSHHQSQVDAESYKTLLEENPKRNYLLESKYTQIERQNRLLFEKISNIKRKKKSSPSLERMGSLNITFRRKQNESIQNQNVRIYNRILKQRPFISFKQTDKEFMAKRKMSDRLSKKEKYRLQDWY